MKQEKYEELYMAQFKSAGVLPTGPISPWPKGREIRTIESFMGVSQAHATDVKATFGQMAKGLASTAKQALQHGNVSPEIRTERWEMCQQCPEFIKESKRCSLCGCFMKAKTWVKGDPKLLCPAKKWLR